MNKTVFFLASCLCISCFAKEYEDGQSEGLFDKNKDGVIDFFYEYAEDGSYVELVDSNYDGKTDERCKYDLNDTLVSCSHDQDFNGHEETKVEYRLGMAYREGIDSDNNQSYEIVFLYKSGILSEGFKYYENKGGKRMIGNVKFKFGYPSTEELIETELSEEGFSKSYWLTGK